MRIAYIAAGAGGMYCGGCLRDNALAWALNQLGHPTVLVPTYTPLRTDEASVSVERVFYGGIGIFLAQKFSFLRRPVPLLDRLLSAPGLLRLAARLAISTRPESLGDLTLSVLRGEQGHQKKALAELLDYLEWEVRPEVVHITNALLSGLAPAIRKRLRVPVMCSLQGEDLFLDGLTEEHRRQATQLIREAAKSIDSFVAVSGYTADSMARYLEIDREKIQVVHPGIRLDGYPGPGRPRPTEERPFTVGYLARVAPEKGLAVLAEAYRILRESTGQAGGTPPAAGPPRLRAAGYLGPSERAYLSSVKKRISRWGVADGFEYIGEVDRAEKVAFLCDVDVLSVPCPFPEAMGLFVYEALACETPVVLPRSGAFPEIIEATGGGILVEPDDPGALASGIRELMEDPDRRRELGRRGGEAVREKFSVETMARSTIRVYDEIFSGENR